MISSPRTAKPSSVRLYSSVDFPAPPIEAADDPAKPNRVPFRQVAYTGGKMNVPGYSYPVVLDLAGAVLPSSRPMLLEHDRKSIAGQSTKCSIEAEGLVIEGYMLETPAAAEVLTLKDQGFQWQASVGAAPLAPYRFVQQGQTIQANGQEIEGPFLYFPKWGLGESSFVAVGADMNTVSEFGEVSIAASMPMYPVIPTSQAPAVHVARDYNHNETAIECALLRTLNCGAQTEKDFNDEINSAADKMRGITIHGVMARAVTASGHSPIYERVPLYQKSVELITASAAATTVSLPKVFANTLNKAMLAQMSVVPQFYTEYCKIDSASDFKAKSFIRLSGVGGFQKVNAEGELKALNLVDAQYDAKLRTWGSIIGLTREQMINDDVGAFAQLPEIFGRAAQIAIIEAFFRAWLDLFEAANTLSTLPPSGHPLNGVLTSRALDPTTGCLDWVLQSFRDQTDSQGMPILNEPTRLMVPTSLEVPAKKIMTAISATTPGGVNVHSGSMAVDVSPYLNNTKMGAKASQVDYYVMGNKAMLPPLILLFLNGQSSPTFESSDMEFSVVGGMRWRGYWDFGFNNAEKQGALKIDV